MAERGLDGLSVVGLVAGYGGRRVLDDVSIEVAPGEVVAVLGHNGAGKSTLLRTIFGLLPVWSGAVALDGLLVTGECPVKLLKRGVSYAPQGANVFRHLTVAENLQLGGIALSSRESVEARIRHVLTLFPQLGQRLGSRAGALSGGERQMAALAAAMVAGSRVLLLDEPSLGLAPRQVNVTFDFVRKLANEGAVSVVLVEQRVREALRIAERAYVLRNGRVVFAGAAQELGKDGTLRQVYL